MKSLSSFVRSATLLVAASAAAACAVNPVSGKRELSLISQADEIQMGKDASAGDLKRVGETNKPDAQALVRQIGAKISSKSERPGLPWEFHLLDDAAVNAFAYPGGFIFVTRGLMTYLTNEAELAEVIGHEIGHVTAKHTVAQMSKQQVAQIGLVGASVLSSSVAKYGDLLGSGAGLLFLKFGRDDETQADGLGFKYSVAQGYDVREAANVFRTLGRLETDGGGARVPEWQSTHPDPGNRVQKAQQRVAELPPGTITSSSKINRDGFLRAIDGMVFGENPRLGYFKGTRFLHPDLKFEFVFPAGWRSVNGADAVQSQSADNAAQLQLAPGTGTPAQAVQKFTSQQGVTLKQNVNISINGLPSAMATFDATSSTSGTLTGEVAAVQYGGATYLLLGLVTAQGVSHLNEIDQAIRSFRPLTDAASLNVQPAIITLVTIPEAMTGQAFVQRYPSSINANTVYIINEIEATTSLPKGMVLKRVVGGVIP
jgi:predicted Zn-dependent protease